MEDRSSSGWINCFNPANKTLYGELLGMSLQSFQQLTGANYFLYYGATIFQSVGIQDSFQVAMTQIIRYGLGTWRMDWGKFSNASGGKQGALATSANW